MLKYEQKIYDHNFIEFVYISVYRQTLLPLYFSNPNYQNPNVFYNVGSVCFQPKNEVFQIGKKPFDSLNTKRKFLCFETQTHKKQRGSIIGFTFEMTHFISFEQNEKDQIFDFFHCIQAPSNYCQGNNNIYLTPSFDKVCFPRFDDVLKIFFCEKKQKTEEVMDGNYFVYFQHFSTHQLFQIKKERYIFPKKKWFNSLQNEKTNILDVLKKQKVPFSFPVVSF